MNRHARKIWPTLLSCAALIIAGGIAGFLLRPVILPPETSTSTAPVDEAPQGHGSAEIVELKESTMKNMNLAFGKFEEKDYYQKVRIPAEVIERIPQSRRSISSPIGGRITKVYVARGQAIRPGAKLFDIQITDRSLTNSQVELLNVFSKMEVSKAKLARLRNIKEGVVARTKLLDAEFEFNTLKERRSALIQELGSRGMDDVKVMEFIKTRKLAKDISVFAPALESKNTEPLLQPTPGVVSTGIAHVDNQYFTVEAINALEGSNLELGQALCELTHHSELLVKGLAFEGDIEKIAAANQQGWKFTAQFGEGDEATVRKDLRLYSVDNHVDKASQTFPIYIEIDNEIISQTTDSQNRTYVNWRFKPGQRAHLEVPIELWEKQIVVPLAALVREGPESFVFMKISHTHTESDGTIIHEFQKVAVKVLHTDKKFAVLARDSKLDIYENFALDQAYQLNLALKQAAGGGGHNHSHDH